MSIERAENSMWSSDHPHTATRVAEGAWRISWIPDQILTVEQAMTAMAVASTLERLGTQPRHLVAYLSPLSQASDHLGFSAVSKMLALYQSATST